MKFFPLEVSAQSLSKPTIVKPNNVKELPGVDKYEERVSEQDRYSGFKF
jgi:hypothetical protein